MTSCEKCGRPLSNDEIAIYRRLVDRRSAVYSCKDCLARKLGCDPELIDDKIRYYREHGCFLFPPE